MLHLPFRLGQGLLLNASGEDEMKSHRLDAVEVAAAASATKVEAPGALIVLLSNRRRVEVRCGFDEETLTKFVAVQERL